MKIIPVGGEKGAGLFFKIDDEDYEKVIKHSWSISKQKNRNTIYLHAMVDGEPVRLHRYILDFPSSQIDHIDGDGLNNQRKNLRLATHAQNNQHAKKRKDNTTGYKGVCFIKTKGIWSARIQAFNKRMLIGYFNSPIKAAKAYNEAALKYHGEFAVLNTIMDS